MTTRNTAKVIPSIGPAAAVLLAASLLLTAFTWANDLDVTTGLERTDASGRIVDTGRMPVSGAEVFLYYMHCVNGFHNRLAGKTLTREDGSFRFEQAIVWEPRRLIQHNGSVFHVSFVQHGALSPLNVISIAHSRPG